MKIEKVNENQIRCTLTSEDLASRELKISELAYGTEKAKTLFRDMMQQANFEFGFEAEDIPLMIEAIPLNAECIVLIITKVDDPEELDTRFSRFAPSITEESDLEDLDDDSERAEMFDLLRRLHSTQKATLEGAKDTEASEKAPEPEFVRIFRFPSLRRVICAAEALRERSCPKSSLYKETSGNGYFLVLSQGRHHEKDFNKVCNMLSEYGEPAKALPAFHNFLQEHCEPIIASTALLQLSNL